MVEKAIESKALPWFSTGADLLDLVVGGGRGMGYPTGRIINIVGDKSTGKTFLACELIAASFYADDSMRWVYDDCESGFGFDTETLYGVEIMPEDVTERRRSGTVEELYSNVREFLESLGKGQRGIYVVDSLDGLTSTENEERADDRYKAFQKGKEFDQGSYQMGKAKFLSQEFFPPIVELIEEKNALLVIISQIRTDISRSFNKWTRAGGKALDFYAHTVLWLDARSPTISRKRAIGVVIKAHTTKSKTARPFRECYLEILFDYGVDNIASNVDFLYDLRTAEEGKLSSAKNAKSIIWEGESKTGANLQAFVERHEAAARAKKAVGSTPTKTKLIDWIEGQSDLAQPFGAEFGAEMSRAEIIGFIDSHGLEDRLTEKVVEKWEQIEKDIKTNRVPKYRKKPPTKCESDSD